MVFRCYHAAHGTYHFSRAWISVLFLLSRRAAFACSCLHVHVSHAEGEAKFWLEPQIALAQNIGLSSKALRQAQTLIEEHEHDIHTAWQQHFGS